MLLLSKEALILLAFLLLVAAYSGLRPEDLLDTSELPSAEHWRQPEQQEELMSIQALFK